MEKTDAIKLMGICDKPDNLTTLIAAVRAALPRTLVLTATDGPAGIELAAAEDPDVILLDIVMPGMDGFEVCRRLKADDRIKDIPVVFLTALKTDSTSRAKALEAGGDGFLAKPLETAELTAQIRAMTKVKAANRSRRTEKETLESLRESDERFHQLFEKSPLGYQSLDSDGRFIEVNHSWLETLGYRSEEVIGKWFGDFLAPEYVQSFRERFPVFKAEGKVHSEFFIMHKDGSRKYLSFDGRIEHNPDGSFKQTHCILKDETDHKKAEEALKTEKAKLNAIFEHSPVAMLILDETTNILAANKAAIDLCGCDKSLVIHHRPGVALHCTHSAAAGCGHGPDCPLCPVRRGVESLIAGTGGPIHNAEIKLSIIRENKQQEIWLEVNAVELLLDAQRAVCISLVDITGRMRAKDALSMSTNLLSETERIGKVGGWSFDIDTMVQAWTDEVYRIHEVEISPNPSVEKGINYYTKESRPIIAKAVQRAIELGEEFDLELEIITAKGNTRAVHTIGKADLKNRRIYGFFQDITERKRAEEEYKTLFREMMDGFALHEVICDAEGKPVDYRFLAVNPSFERMTGLKATDIVGRTVMEVMPEIEQHWIDTYGRVALSGEPAFFENHAASLGKTFKVTAFRPAIGKFACIFADITERKRAEAERENLQAQFWQSQKMESVGRLAGGVAHDFNNLLMGIMGYTELCQKTIAPDHPIQEFLNEIKFASQRSAEITRQLLAFARKQTIKPRVLDLNDAVGGMLKLLRRLIGEDVKLAWRPGADLQRVMLDPAQVDQILANLCINARDAIGGGGEITLETGSIAIDAAYCASHPEATPGAYICLKVSDNGCGMDKETLAQIFEPFFTTKGVGNGTGLGLPTVYGIVKQNSGFIYAESELGKGATFRIFLPAIAEEAAAPVISKAETPRGRGETVILVEDEESVRKMCGLLLEALGYKVLVAESPGKALEMTEQHSGEIHLLLTDVVMPGMDGRQLAQRISAVKPGVKVVFMSGYMTDVIAQRGVLDEGVQFLAKPFARDELARKVREVLDED